MATDPQRIQFDNNGDDLDLEALPGRAQAGGARPAADV